jgi:hypothetical protein
MRALDPRVVVSSIWRIPGQMRLLGLLCHTGRQRLGWKL